MPTEAELLKAVLAKPDDDKPRLAYAMPLGRAGDPRAEFIRAQVEYARIKKTAPANELYNLGGRIIELRESHARAWSAPISPFVQEVWFHRGFVELVGLPARDFLDHADRLFSLAPIRHLDITDVRDDLVELFASEHLAHIRSLGLSGCALGDADIEVLANSNHLGELWWLSLAKNRIGLDGADALAKSTCLPKLRYVEFGANPVDPVEQFSHDSGFIVETWLPDEGEILERRHGHIPWLHLGVERPSQVRRDRFGRTP